MPGQKQDSFPVLKPNLQISFYYRFQTLRELYFSDALAKTVADMEIRKLDNELSEFVDAEHLRRVASFGLRGEIFFPVPSIILANPFLLGYYRLLFGLSQKEFYSKGPFGRFKRLEEEGKVTERTAQLINALCKSLIETAKILVDGLDRLSLSIVLELQLLTVGPQLRGGENTRLGQQATKEVRMLMEKTVKDYIKDTTERTIIMENDSRRTVLIEFFSDPDVRITEKLESGIRPLVSIEIKGGTDASNIHNRLGEAEKSHQKAKNRGFFEFWTIVRVDVDSEIAGRESPTTSHFFHLDKIQDPSDPEYKEFRDMLASIMSIRV